MQLIGELGHSPRANEPGSLESLFRIRDVRAQKFRWLCVQQTDLMRFPKNIFLVYFSTPASVSIGNGDNFLLWQDYSINELSMPNMVLYVASTPSVRNYLSRKWMYLELKYI